MHDAEIFVGVLGASSYTYAEASFTQTLPDWIDAHVRMFRFFGGVPRLVVPDNLKSGVHKASFYDPEINRSYGMMAAHYGVGVLPARPRKPRDKAKVEAGVRFAQSYILGRLRHQTFFSLAECNTAIASCLDRMNAHVMRRLGVAGGICSTASSGQRCGLCQRKITNMRNGASRASDSTIMSRSKTSSTRCRTPSFALRSISASPRAPSRSSIAAGVSLPISAATAVVGMAPIPTTCRARIAATPNGHRTASGAGRG
ncbi:MAG: hypothetical protein WAN75_00140, partial [Xanthobacteraceae bacterium]